MAYQSRLEIVIDSRTGERNLRRLQDELDKTEREGSKSFGKLKSAGVALGAALSAIGIGLLARQVVQASDSYAELRSQIRLVTDSQEELNSVYNQALKSANDTRQSLDATVDLYTRLARSTEELGLSNEQLFTITEAINQSFVVSGASAEEAAGAIRQLSQGMASGTLRGDELNSVLENSPRLARAIADSLGVTIGQLRQLGADGEINAARVARGLLEAADDIERDFQNVTRTVGQAMQQLRNDVLNALGPTNTDGLVGSIDELREIVNDPQFQQSMVTLTSALFTFVGAAAKATAETVNFTKWIGEELAAAVHGPAFDDIPRLEDKIRSLKEEIADAEKLGTVLGGRGLEYNQKRIEALAGSLEIYEEALARAREEAEKGVNIRVTEGQTANSAPPIVGGDTDNAKLDEKREKLRASLDERYAIELEYRQRLEEIEELYGDRMTDIAIKHELERRAEVDRVRSMNALSGSSEVEVEDDPLLQRIEATRRGEQIITDIVVEAEEARLRVRQAMSQQVLGLASQSAGQLTSLIEKSQGDQSNAYRAAFLVQQGLAAAQTIVSTELAAATALAPPPLGLGPVAGLPYAQVIRGAGYTSLGIIAATTIGELSGQAHDGISAVPNSGTWNLQKGERVLSSEQNRDLTQALERDRKGQADQPVASPTFVFQISTGVSQTVQSEIAGLMPMIEKRMTNAFVAEIGRGGAAARAVGRK